MGKFTSRPDKDDKDQYAVQLKSEICSPPSELKQTWQELTASINFI